MRILELLEGKNIPTIVVDVQPEYTGVMDGEELPWVDDLAAFLMKQKAPILMLVNAEDQGLTGDTVDDIRIYWEDSGFTDWNKVTIYDKGYGYLRGAMDLGVDDGTIIKIIREMYRQKVSDSRELFDEDYDKIVEFVGKKVADIITSDAISVDWISLKLLKEHSGYICGGGKNECLREVELMMNAFNIKYKEIARFIYG